MRTLLKRLLRWDARSPFEKSVAVHRAKRAVATAISPLPLPLTALLRASGSDKHRADLHQYGPAYAALLRPYRYRRVRLLEIGVGGGEHEPGGQSLLAWRAYFPFGVIVACDIHDKSALHAGRVRTYRADQSSAAEMAALAAREGPFDIIVDDGSHLSAHQLASFRALLPHLRDGGLYVIEDVHTSFWDAEVGGVRWDGADPRDPAFAGTCAGTFLEVAKLLNHAEFVDPAAADPRLLAIAAQVRRVTFEHNLIAVLKGRNPEPSLLRLLGRGDRSPPPPQPPPAAST